jgi:hypothetical protein
VGGQQVIYVNAFAYDTSAAHEGVPAWPWRERLMDMCDGGPSAWGVLFYPVAGVFTDFEFNGSLPGE